MPENPEPQSVTPAVEPPVTFDSLVRRLGGLSGLALIALTLPPLGGFALLYFRDPVSQWLMERGQFGVGVYIAGFAICAGFALLPTYAQAVVGGFVFHFATGFPAAMAGFLLAALIGYAVARLVGGDRAAYLIREHAKWQAVRDALLGGGFWKTLGIVTLVRFPPNSPFAITNLVMAATGARPTAYALGTVIGMAPRTAAAVYIGSQLKALSDAEAPAWYFWAGLLSMLVVLGILGSILNRAIHRATVRLSR